MKNSISDIETAKPTDKHTGGGIDDVVSEMPQVVPDAVAAATAKENEAKYEIETYQDISGEKFDPSKHYLGKDNKPAITLSGKFKLKPGAKFGRTAHSTLGLSKPEPEKTDTDIKHEKIMQAAKETTQIFLAVGMVVVGEEWKAEACEEDSLNMANYGIYERYGVAEIHPIWKALAVYTGYCFKRIAKPQSKSQQAFIWFVKGCQLNWRKTCDWFKYSIMRKPKPSVSKPEVHKNG